MSKITNDGFTLSGTRCFIAVPIWHQWAYVSEAYVICVMYRQESLADRRCRCNSNYCRDETRPLCISEAVDEMGCALTSRWTDWQYKRRLDWLLVCRWFGDNMAPWPWSGTGRFGSLLLSPSERARGPSSWSSDWRAAKLDPSATFYSTPMFTGAYWSWQDS